MALMYDSINLANIPADATDILIYTDGIYAETVAEVKARWPNATYHTISAEGVNLAEWIDVEPGCVWPNQTAASLYSVWGTQGCQGYYSTLNNMQALKEAHQGRNPGMPAEYFDANATGVEHIDPGYVATQFTQVAGYDESDTSPAFEGDPPPPPPPPPVTGHMKEKPLFVCYATTAEATASYGTVHVNDQFIVWSNGNRTPVSTPTDSASLVAASGVSIVPLTAAQILQFPQLAP